MATRATLQRAGAGVLEELLALPEPFPPQVPCGCGQPARYQEMRRKQLVTVLGRVETERPDYRGPHCHHGQSPRDQELQVEGVPYSPGVQRMMAAVGRETSFERGRQPLELLAGVKVTTKAIERQAEAIGAEIAAQEQEEIRQGVQLELPEVPGRGERRIGWQLAAALSASSRRWPRRHPEEAASGNRGHPFAHRDQPGLPVQILQSECRDLTRTQT
ncbi:MAG: hypothetical protein ACLQOO_25245 [Terriglobia bacterium]